MRPPRIGNLLPVNRQTAGSWVFAALCLAGGLAAFAAPLANPDIFWHLSAGRWMAAHRCLPRADWLSSTMSGQPWTDFEWLVQVLWQGVALAAGLRGLWALKLALCAAGMALLWDILSRCGLRPAARGLAVFVWALAQAAISDLRPENFSMLFFLALWRWLEGRRLEGWSAPLSRAELAGLCLGFAFWANLHPGFVYGLALLAVFAAARGLRAPAGPCRWTAAACLAAAALAVLANPYGPRIYLVPWLHGAWLGDLQTFIGEWQPPSLLNRWHWAFWGVFLGTFGVVLRRAWARRDVPLEHLAALLVFGLSAAFCARTALYFLCVAVPVGASALARPGRLPLVGAAAALWLFFFAQVAPRLDLARPLARACAPQRLAGFLEDEKPALAGLKMLNPWAWGGYLGYRLYPDFRVFMDGRYIFHPLLRPLHEASREPSLYQAFLDRHGIGLVVHVRDASRVDEPVALGGRGRRTLSRPAYLFFLPRDQWALVCWDEQGEVFVRRSAVSPAWLAVREYRYFRPQDLDAAALMVREGLVRSEDVSREAERFAAWAGDGPQAREARLWLRSLAAPRP